MYCFLRSVDMQSPTWLLPTEAATPSDVMIFVKAIYTV